MSTIFSHTLAIFAELISTIRSVWSLRRLALLLPVGTSAPRLYLKTLPHSFSTGPVQNPLGDIATSDETYTSTSNVTDFDDDSERIKLVAALSSTPSNIEVYSKRNWDRHKVNSYGEHSFSDQGSLILPVCGSSKEIPFTRYHSVERVHASVHGSGHSKSNVNAVGYCIGGQNSRRCRLNRNRKGHAVPASKMRSRSKQIVSSHRPRSHRSSSDESVRCDNPDSHRIAQLETELSRLRSELARLIVLQEGKQLLVASGEELETRLEGDGESDVDPVGAKDIQLPQPEVLDSEGSRGHTPTFPATPSTPISIPPPPPPPLILSAPTPRDDWRARLIEMKRQKQGNSVNTKTKPDLPPKPADMNLVLRELQSGTIKLRSIPRSPGGTPVRAQPLESNKDMDACAIIARALKKKFCRVRAVLDRSASGSENTTGDSFQESGSSFRLSSPVSMCTFEAKSHKPPFGQHLLRPATESNRHVE